MAKIVQKEDPVLRQTAKEVPIARITSPKFRKTISDMKRALDSQDDGVAIAAPQIGESWRIFVVSGKIFAWQKGEEFTKENAVKYPNIAFINPKIVKLSREKGMMEEGCLSIRWAYGNVRRAKRASIEACGEDGKKISRGSSGLLAQIFQHETEHLDGVLFTDKATDIKEIPPEEPKPLAKLK